jgi:hypothetical protein
MTPDQKRFQRDLALKHVRRFREAHDCHRLPDQRIAMAVAGTVGASVDDVLKWMKEMPNV